MKIISHSADADGWLSAHLVADHFKITNPNDLIMTDYGKHTDIFSKISEGEKVYICDFSFENGPNDMKKLLEITTDVVWIDHHESSIKAYGDLEKEIKGLRVNGTAACMLTWLWFNKPGLRDNLTQEVCEKYYSHAPLVVRLVHDNDVWRHEYNESKYLKLGLDSMSYMNDPLNSEWNRLIENESRVKNIIENGIIISKYRDTIGGFACKSSGFECNINGHDGFALNIPFGGSPWFGDIIKEYDFVCSFHFNGKEWEYSFYSDKNIGANCYEIAKSINPKGGGHLHAAGCQSDKFIF